MRSFCATVYYIDQSPISLNSYITDFSGKCAFSPGKVKKESLLSLCYIFRVNDIAVCEAAVWDAD